MSAQEPRLGAEAPGAPAAGGQAAGAGSLAPGAASGSSEVRLEELEEQFEELKEKFYDACMPIVRTASDSYRNRDNVYDAWLVYAFNTYDYFINGIDPTGTGGITEFIAKTIRKDVNEVEERVKAVDERTLGIKIESLKRVIETCDKNQNFIDFARLKKEIRLAEEEAEEEEHEEILELLERMKTMTVGEFLEEWEDIVEKLSEYDNPVYDNLMWSIYHGLEFDNPFGDALAEEIEYLARELLGATEKRAERLIECLVEC